ncbi:MAG: dual specificity protein phosphatase [Planctomycetota bacterium]|nr:dual specificity protein phosphatase [Planctomycetota bacterium]MDA1212839.1 dual specificity protein phosphatase [Planctomycetota bacterium]
MKSETMREIIPELLWTGNARDARDLQMLHDYAIIAVVDVAAEEEPCRLSRDMIYCRFPLVDGGENERSTLLLVVQHVAALIAHRVPTLVSCGAGMSRSPAITAMSLSIVENSDPDEALTRVFVENPHDVSPQLWEELKIVRKETK